MNKFKAAMTVFLALLMATAGLIPNWHVSRAANHREAPITALDHKADIADFFAFRSYDNCLDSSAAIVPGRWWFVNQR